MGWVGVAIFLVAQIAMLFAFYRVVLRPLPEQINDLLFKRHLENDFSSIASDTADLVRVKLLELEEERLEAIIEYEALKGLRLNTTEKAKREAMKKAADRLSRQVDATRGRLEKIYAPPVLLHLRKFEELRFVVALNALLDDTKRGRRR